LPSARYFALGKHLGTRQSLVSGCAHWQLALLCTPSPHSITSCPHAATKQAKAWLNEEIYTKYFFLTY
jgi:hypothetical protein